jgi:ribosomal protein S18 acetylase RimI-like enzyme
MTITLTDCTDADWDTLMAFMAAFNAEDGHYFGPENEEALRGLVADPHHGRALMIRRDGEPVGYAILCYGYALEFHGRDGFLDEIFIAPEHRGFGIAAHALEKLVEIARADGLKALHLEVMDENEAAARLYKRSGWEFRPARTMTRYITRQKDA